MTEIKISPSQVNCFRQCQRKYCWEYVHGLRPPSSAKQEFGTQVHSHLEKWLRTATMPPPTPSGKTAKQGLHLLPAPDESLIVEEKFKMFWTHPEIHVGGLADVLVPPALAGCGGRPLIVDHKTTSASRWMKTEDQLQEDPQVLIYSAYAMIFWNVSEVVARWIYYIASSPPNGPRQPKGVRAIDVGLSAQDPVFIGHLVELTNDMRAIQSIRLTKPAANSLQASPQSCSAFGGCPHAERCKLTSSNRLEAYMSRPSSAKRNS